MEKLQLYLMEDVVEGKINLILPGYVDDFGDKLVEYGLKELKAVLNGPVISPKVRIA